MEHLRQLRGVIIDNYYEVLEKIHKASIRVGSSPSDVNLVVVTKNQSTDIIQILIDAGVKNFGENYVEEADSKIEKFRGFYDCIWHMIGHIQSRKSSDVVTNFSYVHSLDSLKLAHRLNTKAKELDRVLPVFIEINIMGEQGKYGWRYPEEVYLLEFLSEYKILTELNNLKILGLMTIPPIAKKPEDSRVYFNRIRHLQEFLQKETPSIELKELSMGMSSDYQIAIEEGATWIRIGQAIFGSRIT